jgi:hypothetical protein
VGKAFGIQQPEKLKRTWEDNIKIYVAEICCENASWN